MSPFEFSFPTTAFYQPSYTYEYEPAQPSLIPLFRLLDEWENANTQAQAQAQRQQPKQPAQNAQAPQQQSQASKRQSCPAQCAQPQKRPAPQTPQPSFTKAQPAVKRAAAATTRVQRFSPNFDARETETAYELYGELPGAVKENINIEFTDPQTIVISGKVERKVLPFAAAAASSPLPEAKQIEAPAAADSETPVQEEQEQERPRSPYQATVEDTDDEEFETISKVSSLSTGSRRSSSATVDTEKMMDVDNKEEVVQAQPQEEKVEEEEQGRYLLQERTIGEFQRVFSFPGLVDQDGVHASLENGILSVRVPKKRIVLSKGIWIH